MMQPMQKSLSFSIRLAKGVDTDADHYFATSMKYRNRLWTRGDSGERRMAETPSPDEISEKLTKFCRKWEQMWNSNGKRIWTSGSADAVANLQKHVGPGCLSNILPSYGTNRNERFHRFLNSFFNKSKIGVFLAYALMTVSIHAHNSQT